MFHKSILKVILNIITTTGRSYALQEAQAIPAEVEMLPESNLDCVNKNRLEMDIDYDIVAAADDMKKHVARPMQGRAVVRAPFDPNLECPTCAMKFRIGQIQKFREHASSCERKLN